MKGFIKIGSCGFGDQEILLTAIVKFESQEIKW